LMRINIEQGEGSNLQSLVNKTFDSIPGESFTSVTKLIGPPEDVLMFQLGRGQKTEVWNINVDQWSHEQVIASFSFPPNFPKDYVFSDEEMKLMREQLREFIKDQGKGGKIVDDPVGIPENDQLDMSFAYGQEEGSLNYQIKSFIRLYAQDGRYGHYVSFVKKEGQWYRCDDGSVTKVDESKAKDEMSRAYVYMLEKV